MRTFTWTPGERQYVLVNGSHLETMCFGPSPDQGMSLVLLHEGLGCIDLWRSFPQALSEATGFGVLVYSRAGYGGSDPVALPRPLDYMTREANDVLPKILDEAGIERVVLIGHSDGASIAAIYAGSVEDFRVRGLVLIAPHFFTEPEGLTAIVDARTAYEQTSLREKLARYHQDVDNAFRGWNDAWLAPGFVDWNITDVIDYWRIPVLAIQGRQDQYGSLAQIHEIENRIYSPIEVEIIDDCKHSPHVEQPLITETMIAEFVHRLDRLELTRVDTTGSMS